jgi:hypothetical protein
VTLRVTVVDVDTGDTSTQDVAEGDYLLITHEPCHETGVQIYSAGRTHVITVTDRIIRRSP